MRDSQKTTATKYTKSYLLILEALTISLDDYTKLIKKVSDRKLFLLLSSLNEARNQIVEAVSNTSKFEVKPSPEQYQGAEKVLPIIQKMQVELELRLKQSKQKP